MLIVYPICGLMMKRSMPALAHLLRHKGVVATPQYEKCFYAYEELSSTLSPSLPTRHCVYASLDSLQCALIEAPKHNVHGHMDVECTYFTRETGYIHLMQHTHTQKIILLLVNYLSVMEGGVCFSLVSMLALCSISLLTTCSKSLI